MANSITATYKVNGSRLFTLEVQIVGDGSGDESDTELIVPATDLTGAPSLFKLRAIQWSLDGFSVSLDWEATTNDHAFTLPAGSDGVRFSDTGAHISNPGSTGSTGSLLFSTSGLVSLSTGTIIIEGQHS